MPLKHLALFVMGHSPAILTETLAASMTNPPDSIRVCTTTSGAAILCKALLEDGGWKRFQSAYPCYQQLDFDVSCIDVPYALDDIRSSQDNQSMAQAILEMVQSATQSATMVSASIAGGRKTMGYLLGFAMGLFARPEDRMTHVLVPEAWERDRRFLFPKPEETHLITLVDIPFVRLGNHLKAAIAQADVKTIVASAQTAIDMSMMHPVTLHIRSRKIFYLGKHIELSDREFSIYQFFSEQKLKHCQHHDFNSCLACQDCLMNYDDMDDKKEDLLLIRGQFGGVDSGHYVRFEEAWKSRRAAANNLHEPLRRIAEAIEKVFGADPRAECLMIRNVGKKGAPRYGIMADKAQLSIERGVKA